ncbi:hypothetical protein J7I93_24390 [Bacillus sp. ISL-47]|uniref:DUF6054 family protein n=1 Tax=Bacillus sp. ISL-47 TaxID=2819130 RepID=UPI001BEBA90D|nr:DUF6054 family protein [Bacillus sp. ISL-47]MBT2691279.1 hypothetical protein [Bacillus sp. ISL-47]MBT2711105.1 hypothetical protein [Pseudomonas sp. ISL-84]
MDLCDLQVNLNPSEAGKFIINAIVNGSISGTLIDEYKRFSCEHELYVIVLEKFYYRTSNRASMTVTIDNFNGITNVHAVSSGSSQGAFFRFDWGAGGDFIECVKKALYSHRIE